MMNNQQKLGWAWLAGIFDSGGSIQIVKGTTERNGSITVVHSLQLAIADKDERVARRILDVVGEGRVYQIDTNWGRTWAWKAGNRIAARVLESVTPLLVIRRKEAEIGLALAQTKTVDTGYRTSSEMLALRDKLKEELRSEQAKHKETTGRYRGK